jgi:hypothetical protein
MVTNILFLCQFFYSLQCSIPYHSRHFTIFPAVGHDGEITLGEAEFGPAILFGQAVGDAIFF